MSNRFFARLSIGDKLVAIILLVVVLALLTGFSIVIVRDINSLKKDMFDSAVLNVLLVAEYAEGPLVFEDPGGAKKVLHSLENIGNVLSAFLYNHDNELLASYHKGTAPAANPPPPRPDGFHRGTLHLSRPVISIDEEEELGRIYLVFSTSALQERIRLSIFTMGFIMVGLTFLSFFSARRLQKTISAPILELARVTETVSNDRDLSIRVQRREDDEIAVLYRGFNKMLEQIHLRQKERDLAEKEIRKLNEELEHRVKERTAQLETSNRDLQNFAYSVAHDLRSPLRTMNGFAKALYEDYRGVLNAEGIRYIDRICSGADRMARLIDDLLKLAGISRVELKIETVDLSSISGKFTSRLLELEPLRETEFIIAPSLTAPGDVKMLTIMLENLLGNAWKFTGKKIPALIEFGVLEEERNPRTGATVFFVRHNGVGFDMAYSGKLFGVFQRLHGVKEFPGSGIGLAVAHKVIQLHGGRIWAQGKVDEGAVFYFTLEELNGRSVKRIGN
ncbi:MAG: HAMP domain-containing protein [bacterium]|nr:HAMP domain-containing protein [bacterium]